jgi:PAS domain-containing protein
MQPETKSFVGAELRITELERELEAARQRAEENAAALDLLPAIVWVGLDPDCRVITGNKAANHLTGTPQGGNVSQSVALEGKAPYLKQLKPDGSEYNVDELPMQQAIATKEAVRDVELRFVLDSGE